MTSPSNTASLLAKLKKRANAPKAISTAGLITPPYNYIIKSMDVIGASSSCACCGEDVGLDDANIIKKQICDGEKNCTWCGDDFNLNNDEQLKIKNNEHIDTQDDIDDIASTFNYTSKCEFKKMEELKKAPPAVPVQKNSDLLLIDIADQLEWDVYPVEGDANYEIYRRDAINATFGIDVNKEPFDPGYVDSNGEPNDRIFDGVKYDHVDRYDLATRILIYVRDNPKCKTAKLRNGSKPSRTMKKKRLNDSPIARVVASGLVECTSTFSHFQTIKNKYCVSRYFGKIPHFKREFTISERGNGVLKKFDKGKKRVLI